MKKLLFLLIAFLAWGTSAYSQEFIKGMEISFYGNIKKDNNVDPEDMPQTRCIIFHPGMNSAPKSTVSIIHSL